VEPISRLIAPHTERSMELLVRSAIERKLSRKRYGRTRNGTCQAGFEAKSEEQSGTGIRGCRVIVVTGKRGVCLD
jgi:hypothetical protein